MSTKVSYAFIDRRAFVVGGAQAAALLATLVLPGGSRAFAGDERVTGGAKPSLRFVETYRDIAQGREPMEGVISLKLPSHFDNGHAVPFSISVESPMTAASFVSTIHMVSTANPVAPIATFHLTPDSGEATVSGRFRLAKSQDVYVLAGLNDGRLYVAKQLVNVKVGGCS